MRRSLDAIMVRARDGLLFDPHITVYTMNPDGTEDRREDDMIACNNCHSPIEGGDQCAECQRWSDYWASLTPAERTAESREMAEYANEPD